jgi:hypothetical protein
VRVVCCNEMWIDRDSQLNCDENASCLTMVLCLRWQFTLLQIVLFVICGKTCKQDCEILSLKHARLEIEFFGSCSQPFDVVLAWKLRAVK